MAANQRKKKAKTEYKIFHNFQDGRRIAKEDFDPARDLTPKQKEFISDIFWECIFSKCE